MNSTANLIKEGPSNRRRVIYDDDESDNNDCFEEPSTSKVVKNIPNAVISRNFYLKSFSNKNELLNPKK